MGAGRTTETIIVNTSSDGRHAPQRNLPVRDLGGVIFGCSNDTFQECLDKQLFGLPSGHWSYVQNIKVGLPVFLFNYEIKVLYGVFEAASDGGFAIDPHAWTGGNTLKTRFPAQVKVLCRQNCKPLPERIFGHAIRNNYCHESNRRFMFELTRPQVKDLLGLFGALPIKPVSQSLYKPVSKSLDSDGFLVVQKKGSKKEPVQAADDDGFITVQKKGWKKEMAHKELPASRLLESSTVNGQVPSVSGSRQNACTARVSEVAEIGKNSKNACLQGSATSTSQKNKVGSATSQKNGLAETKVGLEAWKIGLNAWGSKSPSPPKDIPDSWEERETWIAWGSGPSSKNKDGLSGTRGSERAQERKVRCIQVSEANKIGQSAWGSQATEIHVNEWPQTAEASENGWDAWGSDLSEKSLNCGVITNNGWNDYGFETAQKGVNVWPQSAEKNINGWGALESQAGSTNKNGWGALKSEGTETNGTEWDGWCFEPENTHTTLWGAPRSVTAERTSAWMSPTRQISKDDWPKTGETSNKWHNSAEDPNWDMATVIRAFAACKCTLNV